jgi:hypothetical protein
MLLLTLAAYQSDFFRLASELSRRSESFVLTIEASTMTIGGR